MARYALILIKWIRRALRVRRPRFASPGQRDLHWTARGRYETEFSEESKFYSLENGFGVGLSAAWLPFRRPRIRTIGKPPLAALLSPDGFFARWQTLGGHTRT